MNFSIEQSEVNEMTERLKQFSELVDLYSDGLASKEILMSELSHFETIDWTKENMFNQLLAYNALGTAYGNLKRNSLDCTKAYYENDYVYKEISYYHNLHYVVSRVKKEQWAALYWIAFRLWCRAYMCLANAYDHIGRFCEAQQYYNLAALDEKILTDVEINQGFSYANIHAFYREEEPLIVRRAQLLMKKHEKEFDALAPAIKESVCGWRVPSFDAPLFDFEQIEDGAFEKWINDNYLRINRFCDVEPMSSLSVSDNVKLPYIRATTDRQKLYKTSYEEIKNIFVSTRKLAYEAIVGSGNVSTELLKMTYKNFYSVLDKIALFLHAYLNLPIRVHQADFASIWTDRKGCLREEFIANSQNLSLLALYNVKLDVYGSNSVDYVIDEQTKDLKRIRNFIEHKSIVIRNGQMHYDDYQLQISREELSINTIRLAQLVRCAIIYLCNFVLCAEYDKVPHKRNE